MTKIEFFKYCRKEIGYVPYIEFYDGIYKDDEELPQYVVQHAISTAKRKPCSFIITSAEGAKILSELNIKI